MEKSTVRVLLILLSEEAAVDGGLLPLGSFAAAYYVFRDASIDLILASRLGGYLFLDNSDKGCPEELMAARRLHADRPARDEVTDTICFDDVHVEDFDGAMCLGPPACDTAFQPPERALCLISELLTLGKPLAVMPRHLAPSIDDPSIDDPSTDAPSTDGGPSTTVCRADSPVQAANTLIRALKAAIQRNGSEDAGTQ
jgi:hypothetical protein